MLSHGWKSTGHWFPHDPRWRDQAIVQQQPARELSQAAATWISRDWGHSVADQAQKRGLLMTQLGFRDGFVWFRAPQNPIVGHHFPNNWKCHFGIPSIFRLYINIIIYMYPFNSIQYLHSGGLNHHFCWSNHVKSVTRNVVTRKRCEDGTQLFDEEGNELYGEREWYAVTRKMHKTH